MKKLLCFIFVLFFIPNIGFSSNPACTERAGYYLWHCDNNSPGISIKPGETGTLILKCCYTGPGLKNSNKTYNINIEKKSEYSRNVQQPNGSWLMMYEHYPATKYITNINYDSEITPYEPVEIKVNFSLPRYEEIYKLNGVLIARIDVNLDSPGAFIYSNRVDMRVIIPSSYKPPLINTLFTLLAGNYVAGIMGLVMLILSIILYFKVTSKE